MPNRVIKDSIRCSPQIDSLTWFQEVMFYRLMVTVDDFGRYYANPQIIKSELFPTKEDLTKKAVADGLDALESAGLIRRYSYDGNAYLALVTWDKHQQRRAKKSKFPDSNGNHMISNDIRCNQMISDEINCKQMSPNTNTNTNTRTGKAPLADDADLISIQQDHNELFDEARRSGLPETSNNLDAITRIYGEFGKEATLYGIKEASRLNKVSIAYIEKVARNYGNEKPKDDDRLDDSILKSVVWG